MKKRKDEKRALDNGKGVVEILGRLEAVPRQQLACNQRELKHAETAVRKAHERRVARNAKRLKHAKGEPFRLDLRK
jgi:hypothetical protein